MRSLHMRTASILAVVGAVIANLAIYFLGTSSLDIGPEFQPLASPGSTVFLTVIGVGGPTSIAGSASAPATRGPSSYALPYSRCY